MAENRTPGGRLAAKKRANELSEKAGKKCEIAENTRVDKTRKKNREEAAKLILEANKERDKAGLIRGALKK